MRGYHILSKIIFLFIIISSKSELIYKEEDFNPSLVDYLLRIIKLKDDYFKMTILFSLEYFKITSEILRNLTTPVILNTYERHIWMGLDSRIPADIVVVFDRLKPSDIIENTLWFSDTKFIIVTENKGNVDYIFKDFWASQVIKVFILVVEDNDLLLYKFQPFKPGDCDKLEIILVDKWSDGKSPVLENSVGNFNECPANISIVDVKPNVMFNDECGCLAAKHIDGIEGKVLNEISKKINYKPTYMIPHEKSGWGWIHPKPAGVVGDVFQNRSLIGFGLIAPTIERFESLDLTVPYDGDECITYGVPRGAGHKKPTWLDLIIAEFPPEVWIWLAGCYFAITILLTTIIKRSQDAFTSKDAVFAYIFALTLQIPSRQPREYLLRILFITWSWSSFVLTIAYQTSMGSSLTVPKLDPELDTFQQLLASKLKLTGHDNMYRLMTYDHSEREMKTMSDRFIITNFEIDEAVDKIALERNIAHVRHTTTFLYYALINPRAKGEIHVIKDCIYHYFPCFVMKKRSPFVKRVNQIITNLKEMGITQYWRSLYIRKTPPAAQDFVALSLNHVQGIFLIMLMGYAFAIIFFAVEVVYKTTLPMIFKFIKKKIT